ADDRTGAVRVVERQQLGLAKDRRGAQAIRMPRVPFDLDRPAGDRADKHTLGVTVLGERGSVEERAILGDAGRATDVRSDPGRTFRLGGAAGHSRESQRRSHDLEELLAVERSHLDEMRWQELALGSRPILQLGHAPPELDWRSIRRTGVSHPWLLRAPT